MTFGFNFWVYMIKALWRVVRGRWYVWRDAPTEIVRQAAVLWFSTRKDKEVSDEVREAIYQARLEYKIRRSRGEK